MEALRAGPGSGERRGDDAPESPRVRAERLGRQLHGLAAAALEVTAFDADAVAAGDADALERVLRRLTEHARLLVGARRAVLSARTPPATGTDHPVLLRVVALDEERQQAQPGAGEPRLTVPLAARAGVDLGSLELEGSEAGAFTAEDEAVAVQLARLAAIALGESATRQDTARSEERYRSLVEATTALVWSADAEGRVVEELPSWQEFTGQTTEETAGDGWLAAVHPDDAPRVRGRWAEAVARGDSYSVQYRLRHRDGGYREIAMRGVPLVSLDLASGERSVREWVGAGTDVSGRLAAEEAASLGRRRVELLLRATSRLGGALTLDDVLDTLTEQASDAVGAVCCHLGVLDTRREGLLVRSSVVPVGDGGAREPLHVPLAAAGDVAKVALGSPGRFPPDVDALDVDRDDPAGDALALLLARARQRAWAVLPLLQGEQSCGVLVLGFADRREFGPAERVFLQALAGQAGQAVVRAGLYEQAQELRAQAEERATLQGVLSEASRRLSASLEREELMREVTSLVVPVLADWAAVHVVDPEGRGPQLAAVAHADPVAEQDLRLVLHDGGASGRYPLDLAAAAATRGVQLLGRVVPDEEVLAAAAGPAHQAALRELLTGRVSVVPLAAGGRPLGTLTLLRRHGSWTEAETALLEDLGGRAALAIGNATLFSQQREAALTLQRSLLPQALPQLEGVRFAARYIPGAAGVEVGGDWYDALELPDGRVGLAVGDTMGRGVGAAAVMGQVRAALRGYALEGHAPHEVLRRLDVVVNAFDDLRLTTCVYGVLDPSRRVLEVASAGHLPPLLLGAGGGARYVECDPGLPLGVGGGEFCTQQVRLAPGDHLLLFTDGLVESREVLVDAGLEQLQSLLAGRLDQDPHDLIEAAVSGMGRDAAGGDDVAVLVVHLPGATDLAEVRRSVELELSPTPQAARAARERVVAAIAQWAADAQPATTGLWDPEATHTAVLLSDELVTNAVVHAGSTVHVAVTADDQRLHIAVSDESPALPRRRGESRPPQVQGDVVDALPEGGRGLHLLDALASRWGIDVFAEGKRVWFEVDWPSEQERPSGGR